MSTVMIPITTKSSTKVNALFPFPMRIACIAYLERRHAGRGEPPVAAAVLQFSGATPIHHALAGSRLGRRRDSPAPPNAPVTLAGGTESQQAHKLKIDVPFFMRLLRWK
jgi:hypothetical protein